MKKTQAFITKAIAFLFVAAFITNVTKANGDSSSSTASELKAKVNYIGTTADGVLFSIDYLNEEGKKFTVRIKDEAGEVLYLNSFKGKNYVQKFVAPNVNSKLTFEISSEKKAFQQSFNIEKRVIDEVVVSKN